jgi:hypothetical protein
MEKMKLIKCFMIIIILISCNSCKLYNDILEYHYIQSINNRFNEALKVINIKMQYIEINIKKNENNIEKLLQEILLLEEKYEKK